MPHGPRTAELATAFRYGPSLGPRPSDAVKVRSARRRSSPSVALMMWMLSQPNSSGERSDQAAIRLDRPSRGFCAAFFDHRHAASDCTSRHRFTNGTATDICAARAETPSPLLATQRHTRQRRTGSRPRPGPAAWGCPNSQPHSGPGRSAQVSCRPGPPSGQRSGQQYVTTRFLRRCSSAARWRGDSLLCGDARALRSPPPVRRDLHLRGQGARLPARRGPPRSTPGQP